MVHVRVGGVDGRGELNHFLILNDWKITFLKYI